jgi:hypothetical protein
MDPEWRRSLKTDLAGAITACVNAINNHADLRFKANPSGFSAFVSGVKGFVKDHVAVLTKISAVLKGVSMVAGLLSFVPGVGFIAAPIALATGALALSIDATTMWATGNWNTETLALDTVAVIPGGKIAEGAAALARVTVRGATALTDGVVTASRAVRSYQRGRSRWQPSRCDADRPGSRINQTPRPQRSH